MKSKNQSKLDSVPKKGHNLKAINGGWFPVLIYDSAQKEILRWPLGVKKDLGSILTKLQKGSFVGPPDTESMNTVAAGVFEIRLKDSGGIYRVFYFLRVEYGVIVFHAFKKKTQKTPQKEIETAKRRLKDFLQELADED